MAIRSKIMKMIKHFFKDESGATMVEYALLVTLIAVAVIVTVYLVGKTLDDSYERIVDCVTKPAECE